MVEIKCGLEIHTYLKLSNGRKLFCNCRSGEADPNTNICETCTAQPGAKPMRANREALDKTIAIGLILGCRINHTVLFQRKHYSWPDLPSGYQRTMSGSYAKAVGEDGTFLQIGIDGVHLEEDPAKWDPESGIVDYNRSGKALVEIVTKPDFKSAQQVRDWIKALVTTLKAIDAIDEEAGVKADVNVSIAPYFNRVEIKNVHSFRAIADAIEYETERQEHDVLEGKSIGHETRTWHEQTNRTVFMRGKESAQDYMFIPDPDMLSITIDNKTIENIKSTLPRRPDEIASWLASRGVDADTANIIAGIPDISAQFVSAVKHDSLDAVKGAAFIRTNVLRVLNSNEKDLGNTHITMRTIADITTLISEGKLTQASAIKVLTRAIDEPVAVHEFIKSEGLEIQEHANLDELCKKHLSENPAAVADYKAGKEQAINFIIGKIVKELNRTVDARKVKEALIANMP